MRVTCQHCGKVLNLADDKVPPGNFQLICPACNKKFVVNRAAVSEAAGEVAGQPASGGTAGSEPIEMPRLRRADRELMSQVIPEAFVVNLGQPIARLETELERIGMEEVRQFTSLDDALDILLDSGAGILVVRMDKASAPPCEPLDPLKRLSYSERRRTFVVLVADNVKSLDGQVAFFLQVNCLINARDANQFGALVTRALLFHLRLYRNWTIEATS